MRHILGAEMHAEMPDCLSAEKDRGREKWINDTGWWPVSLDPFTTALFLVI